MRRASLCCFVDLHNSIVHVTIRGQYSDVHETRGYKMVKRDRSGQGGTFQNVLPTMVQSICQCGCNQTFMALNMGRKRKYANDTHKKRAYRSRQSQRINDLQSLTYFSDWSDEQLGVGAATEPDSIMAEWCEYELDRRERVRLNSWGSSYA